MRYPNLLSILLVGGMVSGCGPKQGAVMPMPLDQPVKVTTRRAPKAGQLVLTAEGPISPQPTAVQLNVQEIHLTLTTGAHPKLYQLELPIGDVTIPADKLPPKGLALKNLVASAETPVPLEVVHMQPDAIEVHATTPLWLHWSAVLSDGTLWPLGPAHTAPLELDVDVAQSGGTTVADVHASCPGECWSMDGVANLRDGSLYVESSVEVEAAE